MKINLSGFKEMVAYMENIELENILKMYINVFNDLDDDPEVYFIVKMIISELSNRYAIDNN